MNEHISPQFINGADGNPAYAVIPYDEYLRLHARPDEEVLLPNEVVEATIMHGKSQIQAWRKHLGFTQKQISEKMGITQSAYSQMEANNANLRPTTLKKIADALGIQWEQLED